MQSNRCFSVSFSIGSLKPEESFLLEVKYSPVELLKVSNLSLFVPPCSQGWIARTYIAHSNVRKPTSSWADVANRAGVELKLAPETDRLIISSRLESIFFFAPNLRLSKLVLLGQILHGLGLPNSSLRSFGNLPYV